jgi:hypothetical protein
MTLCPWVSHSGLPLSGSGVRDWNIIGDRIASILPIQTEYPYLSIHGFEDIDNGVSDGWR